VGSVTRERGVHVGIRTMFNRGKNIEKKKGDAPGREGGEGAYWGKEGVQEHLTASLVRGGTFIPMTELVEGGGSHEGGGEKGGGGRKNRWKQI